MNVASGFAHFIQGTLITHVFWPWGSNSSGCSLYSCT